MTLAARGHLACSRLRGTPSFPGHEQPLTSPPSTLALAVYSQAAMVILTAVFLFLCIKSFRDARRARTGGIR